MNDNKNWKDIWLKLFNGTIIHSEIIGKNPSFILYLVTLGIIFISLKNFNEKIMRDNLKLEKELEELKTEALYLTAEYSKFSQLKNIKELLLLYKLNLTEEGEPYKKVVIKCQQ